MREFTLAEIEHFVDPQDKSHPKFLDVAKLEFLMFPRDEQVSGQCAKRLQLGEAVSSVSFLYVFMLVFSNLHLNMQAITSLFEPTLSRELSIMKHSGTLLGEFIFS